MSAMTKQHQHAPTSNAAHSEFKTETDIPGSRGDDLTEILVDVEECSLSLQSESNSKANTALWVMNHAGSPPLCGPETQSQTETQSELLADSALPAHSFSVSCELPGHQAHLLALNSSSPQTILTATPADALTGSATAETIPGLKNTKELSKSKSTDLINSVDDLTSIASTQTRLRLQLKRVKIFTLRKFRSKRTMNSSNDSINSEDSGSISLNSSFVSLPRCSFSGAMQSPESSFTGSQRSLKNPLQPYTPHPDFNNLAVLLTNGENNNHSKGGSVVKSASDSTLLDDLSNAESVASNSTTEDEGTDLRSPTLSRSKRLAPIPISRANSLPAHVASPVPNESMATSGEHKSKRKNARVKVRKTIPPSTSRSEAEEVTGVARDTNNFPSMPNPRLQPEPKEAAVLSRESLFDSTGSLSEEGEFPFLKEVINELTKNKPPGQNFKNRPSNGRNRSEPFPQESSAPFAMTNLPTSQSSPAICTEPKPVKEPTATVSHKDDPENPPETPAETPAEQADEHWKARDADRKAIVEEIIASEKTYVKHLEQISQAVKKIREDEVLDEEILNTIFYNLRLGESAVHHQILLDRMMRIVADNKWDPKRSTIGLVMSETFQSSSLHDNYLAYVKNCENSKESIKQLLTKKNPAFIKFNERFKSRNKSGFDLNHAVTLPANRLSSYQMFLKRYHECTPPNHPDYEQVPKAIQIVKGLLDLVGRVDMKSRQATLKDIEKILDVSELMASDREFLRVDTVSIVGHTQEFGLWMFNDLLLITVNKLPRQPSSRRIPGSIVVHGQHGQDIVPGHRRYYKLHKRIGLEDIELLTSPEKEVKKYADDMQTIESDLEILRAIKGKANLLSPIHQNLSTQVTDVIYKCQQNLSALRRRTDGTDLASLRLLMQSSSDGGRENKMIFKDQKTRSLWEKDFLAAKLNLETANVNKLPPEYVGRISVDRTRAGMQFTCAAASLANIDKKEVWFCNSDASAGHLCRLSVSAKPSLIDCVPVPGCSSRIACICATPHYTETVLEIGDSTGASSKLDTRQSLMWLGCDDGTIHILSANGGLKSDKDHIVVNCVYPIHSIIHIDEKVFVALNRRKILVFRRSHDGIWDLDSPHSIELNTQGAISQLLNVSYKLWCSSGNEVTIIDPMLEQAERSFKLRGEKGIAIQTMAHSRQGIVAVAMKPSCDIKFFHHLTLKLLADVNVSSMVAQKLSKCDEIIKQHKTACLRITSLVCCKHMLWIGTTAGVVLTLRLPKIMSSNDSQQELDMSLLSMNALDIGHTGNVRFLTSTELVSGAGAKEERRRSVSRESLASKMLVISGGDGFEVIEPSQQSKETVGFNDSINHLLVWKI